MQLTETDQAKIGQVRLAIGVAFCEFAEALQMFGCRKGKLHQTVIYEGESSCGAAQVKSCLRENSFTRKKRFHHLLGDCDGPSMMLIGPVGEGDQETRIGDRLHLRENPLRDDRFRGPENEPARRRNG